MQEASIDYTDIFGDDSIVAPDHSKSRRVKKQRPSHKEEFDTFHAANPTIYSLLVEFARKVKAAGVHRYGIKSLFEQIRWHCQFESYQWEPGAFKLNNNLAPYYSRLILEQEPDLHGMFQLRILKA
jgi:hypothetical protein